MYTYGVKKLGQKQLLLNETWLCSPALCSFLQIHKDPTHQGKVFGLCSSKFSDVATQDVT